MCKEVNLLSTNFSAEHTPSATLSIKNNCFGCVSPIIGTKKSKKQENIRNLYQRCLYWHINPFAESSLVGYLMELVSDLTNFLENDYVFESNRDRNNRFDETHIMDILQLVWDELI